MATVCPAGGTATFTFLPKSDRSTVSVITDLVVPEPVAMWLRTRYTYPSPPIHASYVLGVDDAPPATAGSFDRSMRAR